MEKEKLNKDNVSHAEHRKRLRELCVKAGLESFSDHNKLELLLFYALPRVDTNPIAHRLIEHFGSFSAVFEAPLDELKKVHGMGESAALLIKMIPQLSAAYMEDKARDVTVLDTTQKAADFLVPKFIGKTNECMYIVPLDPQQRIIACRMVSEGTPNTIAISIRKIASICLGLEASSVIVGHNHPRGALLPSKEDLDSSGRITLALKMLSIKVVDHMIFSGKEYMSLGDCLHYIDDHRIDLYP